MGVLPDSSTADTASTSGVDALMTASGEDDYTTRLSPALARLALTELNETEQRRTDVLRSLREWIQMNPDIQCRRDTNFLLRFMRHKKYQQNEIQEMLLRYLRMREDQPHWFRNLDVREATLSSLIDKGFYFPLPQRDKFGRRVLFCKTEAMHNGPYTSAHVMRTAYLCFETMMEDEENQVKGFTYIIDEKNVSLSTISMFSLSELAKAIQHCEKSVPMRHKSVHFLNLSPTLAVMFELAKGLLSEKIAKRIQVHSNLEALHAVVDPKILPKEYGGVVPQEEMIRQYKAQAEAVRQRVLLLDQMTAGKKQSQHSKLHRTINKVQRSFKKLEID